jgi:hypothetical protein
MKDPVDPELRTIEKEIDEYYLSNKLTKLNLSQALWTFLSVAEDSIIIPLIKSSSEGKPPSAQLDASLAYRYINSINYPIFWLSSSCKQNGKLKIEFNDEDYGEAMNLLKLGEDYIPVQIAFTYASMDLVNLELENNHIIKAKPIYEYWEYEAYNSLLKEKINYPSFDENFPSQEISDSVKVSGNKFSYNINPKLVSKVLEFFEEEIEHRFTLPESWKFSSFSLGEFKSVYSSILAMSHIHRTARIFAIRKGCQDFGYCGGVNIIKFDDLARMIARYSDLSNSSVTSVLNYLIYGSQGIKKPDPALQPLIKINDNEVLIAPNIWIGINAERNLTVLLNRIPSERGIYLDLVNSKEDLMRKKILHAVAHMKIRTEYGNLFINDDSPDVDLALIDDKNKILYLIELKWFIEPAEVRECVEKSEELDKGITQLKKLESHFTSSTDQQLKRLKIDRNYICKLLLVSANWIGFSNVQDEKIPIINEHHILEKLKKSDNLDVVSKWLESRNYLPKQKQDFVIEQDQVDFGKYSINWYYIKVTREGVFLPLD